MLIGLIILMLIVITVQTIYITDLSQRVVDIESAVRNLLSPLRPVELISTKTGFEARVK